MADIKITTDETSVTIPIVYRDEIGNIIAPPEAAHATSSDEGNMTVAMNPSRSAVICTRLAGGPVTLSVSVVNDDTGVTVGAFSIEVVFPTAVLAVFDFAHAVYA